MVLLYISSSILLLSSSSFSCVVLSLGSGQSFALCCDSAALFFLFTLCTISICVLLWSYYYLDYTAMYRQFLGLVFCFLISIFGLVLASDLISLLVSWDLLGFTSFFLVIYYRTRTSIAGGILTCLSNRIGDILFLYFFGVYAHFSAFPLCPLSYLLILVAMTKSAQVPFSSWLPAAIAAPTPVSALVHSSTLVTAGVYLLFRFVSLPTTLLLSIGVFTTLMAGGAACSETDFKNIVALSTLSQLGLIVSSLGLNLRYLSFIHLNLHASFKALLFLSVGIVIHTVYGSQGFRKLGTMVASSSLVGLSFIVSCSSMCGLTFLSGWVSKEAIMSQFYSTSTSNFLLVFFYLGILLTVAYSFRMVLVSASVHSSHISCSPGASLTLLIKVPLYTLIILATYQGIVLPIGSSLVVINLSFWATFALVLSLGGGIIFGTILRHCVDGSISVFDYLKHSSSLIASLGQPCSHLIHLEVPFSQVGQVSVGLRGLSKVYLSSVNMNPSLLCLFALYLIFV